MKTRQASEPGRVSELLGLEHRSGRISNGSSGELTAPPRSGTRSRRAWRSVQPMMRAHPAAAVGLGLILLVVPASIEPQPVAIHVDAARSKGPMAAIWAFFGYDE